MNGESLVSFGEMLQRYRLLAGVTQEELAERARLSARAISDLERGAKTRPHLSTVRQLAEALQLPEDERVAFQRAARASPQTRRAELSVPAAATGIHTFLIADVRGYTHYTLEHGDDAAARLAARFAEIVDEIVAQWGGHVIELRGDEALAVFVSARQALRAAVELQTWLEEEPFPLGAGIGLDAGEAVAVGAGFRGAALNLAARLCGQAKAGEVLASEGVTHLARKVDGLVYFERGAVPLKGFDEPVKVVEVAAAVPVAPETRKEPAHGTQRLPVGGFLGSLPSGRLVARAEDLAHLLATLAVVEEGQGRFVLLTGEPGIGKTRLGQELTVAAHNRGFLIAAGRCYQPQQSVPYYPFLDALAAAFEYAPPSIREGAAHRWPYLARLLPEQLGASASPPSASPEEQERLLRAVSAFLLALAELRPVALLIDDLHWADSASLQLLQHLARQIRTSRVLLLGTYRDVEVHSDHPLDATLRDLNREQVLERMVLKRFGEQETSTLIAETIGQIDAEKDFAALVHSATDGNPFFTRQVLESLVENGSLYREGGHWKRRVIGEFDVPESVRSVISQRVARLPPEAQEVLQEAGVLGQAFSFDDLLGMKAPHGATDDFEDAVDRALEEAASCGLVRVTGTDRYAFDHALTQQTLYGALSPRRRRRLHLAAGEAIERLPERARTQRAAELSWHFVQGGDEDRAITYALLAGNHAESVFAHAEAERQWRLALELAREAGDSAREAQASEKLGIVLKITGRYEESREMLEGAARILHSAADLEAEGRVVAQIGLLCQMSGTPEEGISRVQPLVLRLASGRSQSLALLYAALVRLYDHAGRQSDQFEASRVLLSLAQELRDERLLAEAELHQGVSFMHLGQYEEALRLLESSIFRAERLGDLHTVCIALGFSSLVYHGRHQVEQAMTHHVRAVDVAERLGDPREISHRAVEAAYFMFLIGHWERSRAYAERALISALELDNLRALLQPLYTLGELSLYTGAWDDASGYFRESLTIAEHLGLLDHLREVQVALAEKDLLEGNPDGALGRLSSLIGTPGWQVHLNFLLGLAGARLAAGDLNGAEEAVSDVVADATRQRLPLALVDALRIQGCIDDGRGDVTQAESRLTRAVERAREISYPWGEARARIELGNMFAGTGRDDLARQQFREAIHLFQMLGAEPYQARADAALADLTERR